MNLVTIEPTADYQLWWLTCPNCLYEWEETTHSLWNVVSLACPLCGRFMAIPEIEFHGDDNARSN